MFAENLAKAEKDIQEGKKIYGIFGFPIGHSLSPLMHNESFRARGLNAEYVPFEVAENDLKKSFEHVQKSGISGLNITIPHKKEIIPHLDSLSPEAKRIGSVNTVVFENGCGKGHNTDVFGFLAPLKDKVEPILNEGVVVFGSGGSSRTVLYALLKHYSFPSIVLISRNSESGNKLLDEAESWKKGRTNLYYSDFNDFAASGEYIWESRLIINCTPLGMKGFDGTFPAKITRFLRPGQIAYDLVYNPYETLFIKEAERHGCFSISGLEMLLKQGAKSFSIWTGKRMPEKKIYALLKEELINHAQK